MNLNPNIHPSLTEYVINLLSKHEIFTIIDFMKKDTINLSQFTNLRVQEIIELKDIILHKFGPTDQNGIDYYNDFVANNPVVKTGIQNFDNLTDGLISGQLYEMCGLAASGKTQICNTIAVNLSINEHWETLIIDAKNDFSGQRIYKMLQARNYNDTECGMIMERIHCKTVYDFPDFMKVLHALPAYLLAHKQCKCVVVDSLPALWFLFHCEENNSDGLSILMEAAHLMKKIATEHHIIFLLVNIVTRWTTFDSASEYQQAENFRTKTTVALSKYWHAIPLQRFLLSRIDDSEEPLNTSQRTIQIIKGNRKGKMCIVNITNKGIE